MPKKLERALKRQASKKHLTGARKAAYVYGTMRKTRMEAEGRASQGQVMNSPFYENGFWWWFDPIRKGWYIGPSPAIQKPSWAT